MTFLASAMDNIPILDSGIVAVLGYGVVFFGLILLTMVNNFGLAAVAVLVYALGVPITTVTIPLLAASLFGYPTPGATRKPGRLVTFQRGKGGVSRF